MENKLIKGAKVATIGLLITKALGILYVIPMNALLSTEAMGIYGISYVQYAFFIQVTLVGFPIGVSKIVAKYRTENNFTMVNRTFKYSVILISILGAAIFVLLFFGTDLVVNFMQVKVYDPEEVALTLKILAPSLLVIPALAISRGYTQGYEDMLPSSISIVVEQVIRIIIIVGGLLIVTKVLKIDDMYAIYIATIASFFSAFAGYIVLLPGFKKYFGFARRNYSQKDYVINFKKIITMVAAVSIPFIVLSTYKGLFEYIDSITINRILGMMNVSEFYIKETISIYTVQMQKLVILTLTIANGFTLSMIPSFSALHAAGKHEELKKRITQVFLLAFFVISFVSLFVAIFNNETYYVFFFGGSLKLGGKIFALSIISSIFYATFNVVGVTLLTINKVAPVVISFVAGMLTKIIFTYIFGYLFNMLNIEPAQVFAAASFVGYIVSLAIVLGYCIKNDLINTPKLIRVSNKIILSSILLVGFVYILATLLPSVNSSSNGLSTYIINIIVLCVAGLVSLILFLFSAQKMNYLKYISGNSFKELFMVVKRRASR
ncbi:MAG: oligosaccharide flippase family protein [Bacilli bacterium]